MRTTIKWLTLALCLTFACFVRAQNHIADSLISILKKPGLHDTVKIQLYGDISWELIRSDINLALHYARKELDLAVKANRIRSIGRAESDLGSIYNDLAIYDTALIHFNKALKISQETKRYKSSAVVYVNMATVYARQSKLKEALDINFKALKLFEQLNDSNPQSTVLNNIAIIYQDLGQVKTATKFLLRSLALSNNAWSQGAILMRLGAVKAHQAVVHDSIVDPPSIDSAFYYFTKAEKILQAQNDVTNLGILHTGLGQTYVLQHKYDKAIEVYKIALKEKEIQEDTYGIAFVYSGLGTASLFKKDYVNAEAYISKSIALLLPLRQLDDLRSNYQKMTSIAEAKGDYKGALKYHQLYTQYKDSLYNTENTKQITELHTKYESEKKDLELAKNKAELETKEEQVFIKNGIIAAIICLVILLAIAGYFFYRKQQVQQKAELDAELTRQKEIRNRSVIEAEEKERIRIATDLHDGVGQMLSAAKLNLSSLEHKLNIQSPEQQIVFRNALDLVNDSVKEVRVVSHNMMPNVLLKLGLASAVKEFITKIQNTPSLKVNLEIVGMDQRMEQEKEAVLYRVIQELVSNIIKHAKATELTLQLIRHDKELTVLIEDNGVGFDTSKINDFEGIGLKNIMSRVEFVNGTVNFDSMPGRGTTVVIEVHT